MTVKELLESKGSDIISMESDMTVEAAIRVMTGRKISAVLVTDNSRPVGIFTERDVLRCYIKNEGVPFSEVLLRDAMTADLIVAEIDEDLCNVMGAMIEKGIRHMPVSRKGSVAGMLSIRDVVKTQVGKLRSEIHYLKDYIANA